MENLKLFVWEGSGVLPDYSSGMICVLAENIDHALELIYEEDRTSKGDFPVDNYKVYEVPCAFLCYGGG